MILIVISFLSGILSVLAPCVLPVIPVIFSWSLSWATDSKLRRILIAMMVSIVWFTVLLKLSTQILSVSPSVWIAVSATIIIMYWLILVFPSLREYVIFRAPTDSVQVMANQGADQWWWRGDVLLGASIGPIFSTCSPTFALLFSTILPVSLSFGLICMFAYVIGFGGALRILVQWGRSLIKRLYIIADNRSVFKRILGVVLIILGVLIATGYIGKLETAFVNYLPDVTMIEHWMMRYVDLSHFLK